MTPRPLIWSPEAISDLREIADYIALDKPKAQSPKLRVAGPSSSRLLQSTRQRCPSPAAEYRNLEFDRDDIREVLKRGYRIMYRVSDERVEIVAVTEGHRQVSADILDR